MILGLKGYPKSSGEKFLIAAYGNDMVNVATGRGYGVNLSSENNVEFEAFLDNLFFQNFKDTPQNFNGSTWSSTQTTKLPLSKYIKTWRDARLYLGYLKIGSAEFPSRVWYSNLPKNDVAYWGYEHSSNLITVATSAVVRDYNASFEKYGLKAGDPLFITSGSDIGEYTISSVDSEIRLTLTESLTASGTVSYWAGRNWFDVRQDDGDVLTWLDENGDYLLMYKNDSLHRYDGAYQRQIRGAVGTTSGRSVQTVKGITLSFYGGNEQDTGFYAFDGREQKKISGPIDNHVKAISTGMYNQIPAWKEGNLYRAYVGDITNFEYGNSESKAVFTLDLDAENWSIDPIGDVISCATDLREAGLKNVYLGDNDKKIIKTPDGYDFDGEPIPWKVDTKSYYPAGVDTQNTFIRCEVISQNASGVKVFYKRRLKPFDSDDNWRPLGQIEKERQQFIFPAETISSGIQLRFQRISTQQPVPIIKKAVFKYRTEDIRL